MSLYDKPIGEMTPKDVVGAVAPVIAGSGLAWLICKVPGVFAYLNLSMYRLRRSWRNSGFFGKIWMLLFTWPVFVVIKVPAVVFINWIVGPALYIVFAFMVLLAIAAAFAAAIPFFMGAWMILNAIVS